MITTEISREEVLKWALKGIEDSLRSIRTSSRWDVEEFIETVQPLIDKWKLLRAELEELQNKP